MELTSSYGLHLAVDTGKCLLVLFNEVNVKILNSVPGDYTTPGITRMKGNVKIE